MKKFKQKIYEWLKRYFIAEIFGLSGNLLGGLIFHFIFKNPIITAIAATWGENILYYGKIIYTDMNNRKEGFGIIPVLKELRNTLIEFGPGEYLDSFIVRPFTNWYFPKLIGNVPIGLVVGMMVANISFYVPTIIVYEIRKKIFRD